MMDLEQFESLRIDEPDTEIFGCLAIRSLSVQLIHEKLGRMFDGMWLKHFSIMVECPTTTTDLFVIKISRLVTGYRHCGICFQPMEDKEVLRHTSQHVRFNPFQRIYPLPSLQDRLNL